ncbi:site-specific integrase [Actinocorallia sp. B10E7]|uniref:site-specific integrase n=1 Tax=Actinocorallia sp. B10E7 TaxID=3153558 RepID=UPI00325C7E23
MSKRRARGDGGLHWDESRQRWIATVTTGYTPAGKRIVRKASGRTKTEAKQKLKETLRDHEDGLVIAPTNYTVADAVNDWLRYGLVGRSSQTVETCTLHARTHVIPGLGARKLRDLSAEDVERWLERKAETYSTRTLQAFYSVLNRAVKRAMARDKVKRNVVALCTVPEGRSGRPSKALTFEQAAAVLDASEHTPMYAYLVLSILIGARTEELRALTWSHVDLDGRPAAAGLPEQPPSIQVWRSVREGGDTKTRKSRRTLALPDRCVQALKAHRTRQEVTKKAAGNEWQHLDLVFCTRTGTELDSHNVRRSCRKVFDKAGLVGSEWTPREMRHSFVSLLSDGGMPLEQIARLCGHAGTTVTEAVYRHQIRPVILEGAETMDRLFARAP